MASNEGSGLSTVQKNMKKRSSKEIENETRKAIKTYFEQTRNSNYKKERIEKVKRKLKFNDDEDSNESNSEGNVLAVELELKKMSDKVLCDKFLHILKIG